VAALLLVKTLWDGLNTAPLRPDHPIILIWRLADPEAAGKDSGQSDWPSAEADDLE
jgi:hypothetical protein